MRCLRSAGAGALAVVAIAAALTACGGSGPSRTATQTTQRAAAVATTTSLPTTTSTSTASRTSRPVTTTSSTSSAKALPLQGKKIGVDPGHNGRNAQDPGYIDRRIWNGREYEHCNTTGTATDGGYTEALFNFNVARYLTADLQREGATVVLTRHNNHGVGPCVNRRAQIFNRAHVAVGVAIHADGGPASGRGFAVLEPVADGINNGVIGPSRRFARVLRGAFGAGTGMPISTYDGVDGLQPRDDLGGENLTTVPYALIECGNMRNAADAALLTSPRWQMRAAQAIAAGITHYLGNSG